MKKAKWAGCAVLMAAFALLTMSCGAISQGVQAGKEAYNLTLVGKAYLDYCTLNKKGPPSADELLKSCTAEEKDSVQQVKDGKFTVIWGVDLTDPVIKTSGAVLGYAPAPINGQRVVILTDGAPAAAIPEATFTAKPKADAVPGTKTKGK